MDTQYKIQYNTCVIKKDQEIRIKSVQGSHCSLWYSLCKLNVLQLQSLAAAFCKGSK